ncbi:MAG: undecaprenyl diphosphate synthase family protein [Planctomycetes bacterium]|nr:undecaprenyl diphosphate synthase family protein [Planctomycetota bacterium]
MNNTRSPKVRRFARLPNHIGVIPDGNRRWAVQRGLDKGDGYAHGVGPGFRLYERLLEYGIGEVTFYGFTKDNNKRPPAQRTAFTRACVAAVTELAHRDANLLVIGNTRSPAFPRDLRPFANTRLCFGKGLINVNFLVNYDWLWDLNTLRRTGKLASEIIPRVDLLIRWGGRCRLSGFLPVQSVYADIHVINDYWPEYSPTHLDDALAWYSQCDVTLGG